MLDWPGQVVIAVCQLFWTREVSKALETDELDDCYKNMLTQVRLQQIKFYFQDCALKNKTVLYNQIFHHNISV